MCLKVHKHFCKNDIKISKEFKQVKLCYFDMSFSVYGSLKHMDLWVLVDSQDGDTLVLVNLCKLQPKINAPKFRDTWY